MATKPSIATLKARAKHHSCILHHPTIHWMFLLEHGHLEMTLTQIPKTGWLNTENDFSWINSPLGTSSSRQDSRMEDWRSSPPRRRNCWRHSLEPLMETKGGGQWDRKYWWTFVELGQEALDFEAPVRWNHGDWHSSPTNATWIHLVTSTWQYIISFVITGGTPVGDQCPKDHRELIIGCTGQELLATSTCFSLIPPISSRVFHKQATKLNGHPPVFNCLPSYTLHSSFKRGSKNKATRPTNI